MSHRDVNTVANEAPEFEGILEAVLLQALEIAREKLDAKEPLVPFTALAVGETLFMETHPSEDPDECFKMAQHTVQNARGAAAYAFCYDGYVETNDGELDAIIAEGGVPGSSEGHAIGYLYTVEGKGEDLKFILEETPLYIGPAPNFMEFTLIVDEDEFDEDNYEVADEDAYESVLDEDDSEDVQNEDSDEAVQNEDSADAASEVTEDAAGDF